ncbi:hypothetical protein LSCM1_02236 [Leishmania martiniquensis]|uniref:DNA-(apurinic or apyrimidinic site) lyase n=1 Tax=Leishmania martiniquensis TaxID=1580590 RepID=A0A836GQS6_9TRYP|nr:hypothetical protein LSCM1_02236 [Leishmania martiniquensis]
MSSSSASALHPWRVLTASLTAKVHLQMTLCGGQCFHWYPTPRGTFVGAIGYDVFELRETRCAAKLKSEELRRVPSRPAVSMRATRQQEPVSSPPISAAPSGESCRPSCCWIEYRRLWPLNHVRCHGEKGPPAPPSSLSRLAGAPPPSSVGESDEEMLSRYLSLDVDLDRLWKDWTESPHTRQHPLVGYLVGNRLRREFSRGSHSSHVCEHDHAHASPFTSIRHVRQDLHSCLFSFLCSQNNNVTRITGMVYALCRAYGDHLCDVRLATGEVRARRKSASDVPPLQTTAKARSNAAVHKRGITALPTLTSQSTCSDTREWLSIYSFPSLEQLAHATEDALRKLGFGYRSKYVVDAVGIIRAQRPPNLLEDQGVLKEQAPPPRHLMRQHGTCYKNGFYSAVLSHHSAPHQHQRDMLRHLPGVGRKVADCVALFALNRTHIVPVDTHMAQIAAAYLVPSSSETRASRKRSRTGLPLPEEECPSWEDVLLQWRAQAEMAKKRNGASSGSRRAIEESGEGGPVPRRSSRKNASPALCERHHDAIQEAFRQLFGNYAGWAHSILFFYRMRKGRTAQKLATATRCVL